ncbi:MAG: hypothetical protein HC883_00130 [Bdellovibrionaceae bacterium]|nr:hypothetical protein [Pseudobdellovibrionaceae bacterium]
MEFDRINQPGIYEQNMKIPGYYEDKGPRMSTAQVAGVAMDVVADPLNFIPVAAIGKGLSKAAPIAREAMGSIKSATVGRFAQKSEAGAEAAAKAGASVTGGALEVEQGGKLFEKVAPQSLDELRQWKPSAGAGELVGKSRLQEIEKVVPDLQTKPLKYHYNMMENPKAMKELKLRFENLPTKDAKQIAAYNLEMVNESASKIRQTVADMAGGEARSLSDAGNDFIGAAKNKYSAEKEALGPMFDAIQKRASDMNQVASRDLIEIIKAESKAGELISQNVKTGRMYLNKNKPRTGLSDAEHGILSRVIDDLNDGMSFKEVQDTREFLRKSIDPANPGASSEIQKVRTILLGQLEHMAGKMGDDVGKTFKGYAVNERSREAVEKIIGGRIETLDAMYAANPDKVVSKIFSNPNYTKVVGKYVGQERMREMTASFIQQGIDKATDSAKGFSPEKFKTWLKTNSSFVKANVDPQTAERLSALADYGYFGKRFLDEVNPSGTAASLLSALEPKGFFQKVSQGGVTSAVVSEVGARTKAAVNQRGAIRSVNEMMGATKEPGLIDKINRIKVPDLKGPAAKVQGANAFSRLVGVERMGAVAADEKPENKGPAPKGPEKWAADGIAKLGSAVGADVIEEARASDQGKRLLIQASDLKPESKAMNEVVKQLKQRFGKNKTKGVMLSQTGDE